MKFTLKQIYEHHDSKFPFQVRFYNPIDGHSCIIEFVSLEEEGDDTFSENHWRTSSKSGCLLCRPAIGHVGWANRFHYQILTKTKSNADCWDCNVLRNKVCIHNKV